MSGREALTAISSDATLEMPLASVTRNCTLWLPGEEKIVLIVGPPAAKAPAPAGSQAKPVMGLVLSVEVEINETAWPTRGLGGNHVNDAAGGAGDECAADEGPVTTNVLVPLTPTLPAASDCSARTVYVPGAKPPNAPDHALALALTVTLWSGGWPAATVAPEKSLAVTCGRSPSWVPTDPPTAWDSLVVAIPFAGVVRVTAGETVSTMKLNRSDVPTSSVITELCWLATTVYAPSGNERLAGPDVQAPRVPVAVAVETAFGLPSTFAPAKISMLSGPMSLALPVNDGVALFVRAGGAFNTTVGAAGSTSKWIGALAPVGFPMELSSVAIAV
jgi:hypothetical protein